MNTQPLQPRINRPRNQVGEVLKSYGAALTTQYPELEGRLTITQREDSPVYLVSFYLLSHKLRGYNTRLLTVEQPIDNAFPVVLTMHYKTYSSAPQTLTEADFKSALRRELASEPVRNILNNMLALGNLMEDSRRDLNQAAG